MSTQKKKPIKKPPVANKTKKKPRVASEVDDLIKPSDFESIHLEFTITNTTTKTDFRAEFKVRLAQLHERGMLLEVPRRSCSLGHSLFIKIEVENVPPAKDLSFEATGKVDVVENFDRGGDLAVISLHQFDEKGWVRLNEIFSARQKQIEDFFTAARGYG